MSFEKLNSWAKVNLSLNVIKRLSNKYHNIESLITFIKIYDEIKIKILNEGEHKIYFTGKFSKGISKNNTILKLLNLLEKKLMAKADNNQYLKKIVKISQLKKIIRDPPRKKKVILCQSEVVGCDFR